MTETARMYGGSLYDLAAEEGLEARILGELDEAVALLRQTRTTCICSAPPASPKRSAAACWMKHCGIRSTSMC